MGKGRYAPREQGALELGLDEELAIEQVRGRVERRARDSGVDVVRTRNGVRSKERDDLEGREASCIVEAGQNVGDAVLGLRDEAVNSGGSRVGTTGKELELRRTLMKATY